MPGVCHQGPSVIALALMFISPLSVRGQPSIHPVTLWKEGDAWTIQVERFARTASKRPEPNQAKPVPTKAAFTFLLEVKVGAEAVVEGEKCLPVDFLPEPDALAKLGKSWRVYVRKRDGSPVKVFRGDQDISLLHLEPISGVSFIASCPDGIPIEIVPFSGTRPPPDRLTRSLALRVITTGRNAKYLTCSLHSNQVPLLKIEQVWPEGNKWWDYYERHVQGRKDMVARTVTASSLPGSKPSPPVITLTSPKAKEHDPAELFADPRLQTKLSISFKQPMLSEILSHLSQVTTVPFSCAPSVDLTTPATGSVVWRGVPVWEAMYQIAGWPTVKGAWEKRHDGYRLIFSAGPTVALPEEHPADNSSETAASEKLGIPWWLAAGLLSLLIISAYSIHRYSWFRKTHSPRAYGQNTRPTGNL